MNKAFWFLAAAIVQITATGVYAQSPDAAEKAAARAERRAAGTEAAHSFEPGEGNPVPEHRAKVSKSDRIAARQARKAAGAEAERHFEPGEGNPVPVAKPKVPKSERSAARAARNAEMTRLQKAGEMPTYPEGSN